jgi:hypothetical protein
MDNQELSKALEALSDRDLICVLRSALENRKPEWEEACDDYGNPSRAAMLATIRKILCA